MSNGRIKQSPGFADCAEVIAFEIRRYPQRSVAREATKDAIKKIFREVNPEKDRLSQFTEGELVSVYAKLKAFSDHETYLERGALETTIGKEGLI